LKRKAAGKDDVKLSKKQQDAVTAQLAKESATRATLRHVRNTHTCRLVDGTSMNEECVAVDAAGSVPKLQPQVDRQVCTVRFLT